MTFHSSLYNNTNFWNGNIELVSFKASTKIPTQSMSTTTTSPTTTLTAFNSHETIFAFAPHPKLLPNHLCSENNNFSACRYVLSIRRVSNGSNTHACRVGMCEQWANTFASLFCCCVAMTTAFSQDVCNRLQFETIQTYFAQNPFASGTQRAQQSMAQLHTHTHTNTFFHLAFRLLFVFVPATKTKIAHSLNCVYMLCVYGKISINLLGW